MMILNVKSFSRTTIITVLSLRLLTIANGAPAPQSPFLTVRMPSTPLPPLDDDDNYAVNQELSAAGTSRSTQSEFVVDFSSKVSQQGSLNGGIAASSLYDNRVRNDTEDEDDNDDFDYEDDDDHVFVLPSSIQDFEEECEEWALEGECNANPRYMLKACQKSCLQNINTDDNDLLAWGFVRDLNEVDNYCEDLFIGESDEEEDCEDWAHQGLCKSIEDKPFMLKQCARACMVCINPDEDDINIGEPQEISNERLLQKTIDVMVATSIYMTETVMDTRNSKYHSVRKDCRNLDPYCSSFAAKGECDPESDDFAWMVLNCAPTCQVCELLDFSVRCPIPEGAVEALSRNGGEFGLHAMFERIVGERELTKQQLDNGMGDLNYTTTIYSRPSSSSSSDGDDKAGDQIAKNEVSSDKDIINGPWVITLDNFLSDEECDRLIEIGKEQGYENSTEQITNRDGSVSERTVSKRRTSTNVFCRDCEEDPIAKRSLQKIATITGFPLEFSEDLQLLQYHPGQFYKSHHDYIPAHKHGPSGPRLITVLLYLNDVEEGGATRFNELIEGAQPVDVQPKRGSALMWPSVLDEDILSEDFRTQHEALLVKKGMKYAANAWLHLRDEKNIEGIACD